MQPPDNLLKKGISALPCLGDGRQSGTSESASILNVSPEAAVGGKIAIIQNNDLVKVDLIEKRVDVMIDQSIIDERMQKIQFKFPAKSNSLAGNSKKLCRAIIRWCLFEHERRLF